MTPALKDRVFPTLAALVTLGLGLSVRAATSGWFAKYAGVALWSTLVFFLIVWVKPRLAWKPALIICIIVSFVVEFLQLTPGPMALYRIHPAFALIFGTTFNAPDLPAYVVGSLLGAGVWALRSRRAHRHER